MNTMSRANRAIEIATGDENGAESAHRGDAFFFEEAVEATQRVLAAIADICSCLVGAQPWLREVEDHLVIPFGTHRRPPIDEGESGTGNSTSGATFSARASRTMSSYPTDP